MSKAYYLYMGQGLVGDLRNHTLCSGQFSNCAPIVFYNNQTQIGGLYHLGGCEQPADLASTNLQLMAEAVNPTETYVLCGAGDPKEIKTDADREAENTMRELGLYQSPAKNRHDLFTVTQHVAAVTTLLTNYNPQTEYAGLRAYTALHVGCFDGNNFEVRDGTPADSVKLNTAANISAAKEGLKHFGKDQTAAVGFM